jgi:NADH dehydrogenase (ubiquinone) Fe-S protein 6
MRGPRFEQTAMDLQPNPLSAMGMVAQDPIRLVDGRRAVCDGGELPAAS